MPHRICSSTYYPFFKVQHHAQCYLPYLSMFNIAIPIISASCITNHTLGVLGAHLRAVPSYLQPKCSARISGIPVRTCMWDKRQKIWKFTLVITHLPGHLPTGEYTSKVNSPNKQEQWMCKKVETKIAGYVNPETSIVWNPEGTDSILWLVLLQTSHWYSCCLMWHRVRMKTSA